MIENPKQKDSVLIDCKPQSGKCPNNCNQCYYNRPGAFYTNIRNKILPTLEEAEGKIVRVNSGHDSNLQKDLVLKETEKYKHKFYNTSISNFDFPAPVVWTANPKEEKEILLPWRVPNNLMFVRLRVSDTNLITVMNAVEHFTKSLQVPVVLTFMAYYTKEKDQERYEYKTRHINQYWCARSSFKKKVLNRAKLQGGRLVTMCGTLNSDYCKDCRNCETYYWQTIKHMQEV